MADDFSLLGQLGARSSTFRKEFKVHGVIGGLCQPSNLTYVNLNRQIKEGYRIGFIEQEIVSGIIKAITPGLPLREYLETK